MKTVSLTPKQNASSETHERVGGGQRFISTGKQSTNIRGHEGKVMLRFVEVGADWIGHDHGCWLPADELEIHDMQGK